MADNLENMTIESLVRFRSKNISDNNVYYGKIQGFVSYYIARQYMDIEAYHNSILIDNNNLPPKEYLHYFIMILEDRQEVICFAKEWILEETFEIVSSQGKVTIKVLDIDLDTDPDYILGILADHGYPYAYIVEKE